MSLSGIDFVQSFADGSACQVTAVVRHGETYIALYDDTFTARCDAVEALAAWRDNPELSFNDRDLNAMARKILA